MKKMCIIMHMRDIDCFFDADQMWSMGANILSDKGFSCMQKAYVKLLESKITVSLSLKLCERSIIEEYHCIVAIFSTLV